MARRIVTTVQILREIHLEWLLAATPVPDLQKKLLDVIQQLESRKKKSRSNRGFDESFVEMVERLRR